MSSRDAGRYRRALREPACRNGNSVGGLRNALRTARTRLSPRDGMLVNPLLDRLQTYPFQKLAALLAGVEPDAGRRPINLYIGEPKHATPEFIRRAIAESLDGLAVYPATIGTEALRNAISAWLARRYGIPAPDPTMQVLPVNGSREALFGIAQAVIDPQPSQPGRRDAQPLLPDLRRGGDARGCDVRSFSTFAARRRTTRSTSNQLPEVWARVQLVYVCSPGNPTGTS
jgi:N-succinyldiaminopimelate aminotransferase